MTAIFRGLLLSVCTLTAASVAVYAWLTSALTALSAAYLSTMALLAVGALGSVLLAARWGDGEHLEGE